VTRRGDFKDAVPVFAATPGVGPRQQGNNPPPPLATIPADKSEVKVSLDLPNGLAGGTHSLVFRGVVADPAAKGGNQNQPRPPKAVGVAPPVTIELDAATPPKKKRN
jgi:hypothetical protein